jgi:hypothetical protein
MDYPADHHDVEINEKSPASAKIISQVKISGEYDKYRRELADGIINSVSINCKKNF